MITQGFDVDLSGLQIWKEAGVHYRSVNVGDDVMDWRDSIRSPAAFRRWIVASDGYDLVSSVGGIGAARKAGNLAASFDLEGMNALDGSLDMAEMYHRLGVRQMLVADNRNNLAGGGCHDEDIGLTACGSAVIGEMNRLGMIVDLFTYQPHILHGGNEDLNGSVRLLAFQRPGTAGSRAQHPR